MCSETVDPRPAEPDGAVRRPLEPDDHLQQRALAGSVRTDDGDDVAVVDSERDAVDGRETAEALRDPIDLEKQLASRYDGGRYGVSGCDLNTTLGQNCVGAVFSPCSGGAALVRMANWTCGLSSSPHAVHLSGNAYPGMLNVVAWTYAAIRSRSSPTFWIACAMIFTYA
jgi:hypothetical protein